MRHGISDDEDVDRMPVPVLDGSEDERTWLVDCLEYRDTGTTEGGTVEHWQQREFVGAELVVVGGALVLRDLAGDLIEARGPGTWGNVVRKSDGGAA